MIGDTGGIVSPGISLVQGGWQGRHDRVPIRVPVHRVRWRRSRTVPDRRRRWFVILTIAVVVTMVVVMVMVQVVVLLIVVGVVVRWRGCCGGGPATGRHNVHGGRGQRRRYPAVRAVHRAQRTRPVLGRRALPCGGRGGSDGRGRGGGAPRLVVDVLVEFHGGGARSTDDDDDDNDYYYNSHCCCWCCCRSLSPSSTGPPPPPPPTTPTYTARGANASEKCCFFLRPDPSYSDKPSPSTTDCLHQHHRYTTTLYTLSHPHFTDLTIFFFNIASHQIIRRVKVIINVSGICAATMGWIIAGLKYLKRTTNIQKRKKKPVTKREHFIYYYNEKSICIIC